MHTIILLLIILYINYKILVAKLAEQHKIQI